jgi:hypothetical protein
MVVSIRIFITTAPGRKHYSSKNAPRDPGVDRCNSKNFLGF